VISVQDNTSFAVAAGDAFSLLSGEPGLVEVTFTNESDVPNDTGTLTIEGSDGLGGSATFDIDLAEYYEVP